MPKQSRVTQAELVLQFFKEHPNRDISHPEVVDWAAERYYTLTGKKLRAPDRPIRKFHQAGILIKVSNGIYRYEPYLQSNKEVDDFSCSVKEKILSRDGYKCVMCGRGAENGVSVHVDHIKPKDCGGKGTLENGQTLCGPHNYLKKNFKQTETGKKFFIRLYEFAKSQSNQELIKFSREVLEVFEKHNMNGHIEWTA